MSIELKIHPIQANILRILLFRAKARFSELNTEDMPTDHFTFHIKRLVATGLIKKMGRGQYQLTLTGKEFANRFDTETIKIERQAKIGILVVAVKVEGKMPKYLIQQRLKQPYYGFHGFLTGKVRWGETTWEAAQRELEEESGLRADLSFAGVEHKMDYDQDGRLLEDKCLFIFRADSPQGKLVEKFEGGRNAWLSKDEILKVGQLFDDVIKVMELVDQYTITFLEEKYTVRDY